MEFSSSVKTSISWDQELRAIFNLLFQHRSYDNGIGNKNDVGYFAFAIASRSIFSAAGCQQQTERHVWQFEGQSRVPFATIYIFVDKKRFYNYSEAYCSPSGEDTAFKCAAQR